MNDNESRQNKAPMADIPSECRWRVEQALAPLGWTATNLRPLARGANNVIYAFENQGGPKVAKVGFNPSSHLLHREWAFLRMHPGIGPVCDALWTDPVEGFQVLVQERLEGTHPYTLDELGLEAMGLLMRRYHGFSAPEGLVREDWRSFLDTRVLHQPAPGAPPALVAALSRDRMLAEDLGEHLELDSAEGTAVPVHGDLIPLNLMLTAQGMKILDWEGLRLDEPEADVATFFKAFRCGARDQAVFLRGYGTGLDARRLVFRRILHDLQVAGWRLTCQIQTLQGSFLEKALHEAKEELDSAAAALEKSV